MRTLDEKKYSALFNDLKWIVSPHIVNKPRRGGEVVKRKLDGQLYDVQPYAEKIKIYSISQLRSFLAGNADNVRGKAIEAELRRRGALK